MSVETEAPAAAEAAEAPNDFTSTLAAAMERADAAPVEEEVVEKAEQTEGEEAESQVDPSTAFDAAIAQLSKEEPKPTAPTLAPEWISEAIRLNVPRQVLKFARSDDEVREMIVEFGDQPEEEAVPAAAFPITDDNFDSTDPTHIALKAVWEQNQQLQGVISKLTQSTTGLITERQREAILVKEQEYDSGLDALNIPELGSRGSQIRKDSWDAYEYLLQRNPGAPKAELAKRAVFATHPDLLTKQATQKQLEAINGQQQRTLGAGPAKPPAKKPPTPNDNFLAVLSAADERARRRMQEAG